MEVLLIKNLVSVCRGRSGKQVYLVKHAGLLFLTVISYNLSGPTYLVMRFLTAVVRLVKDHLPDTNNH